MSREDVGTVRSIRQDRVRTAEQRLAMAAREYAACAEHLAQCVRDLQAVDAAPADEYNFHDLDNPSGVA